MDDTQYHSKKLAALQIFQAQPSIHSPFFNEDVALTSQGFHHLSNSAHGVRTKEEQIRRFSLLPLALHVLKIATTAQEYKQRSVAVQRPGSNAGLKEMKMIHWWSFVALFGKQDLKVRIVVKRVGDGPLQFWSVMEAGRPRGESGSQMRETE